VTICERILAMTDPRLVWERSDALTLLAEAWLMQGDLAAAAHRLREAAELTSATENDRDLRVARSIANRMRQRWPRAPEIHSVNELLRSAAGR
jgi:hypothetical protein